MNRRNFLPSPHLSIKPMVMSNRRQKAVYHNLPVVGGLYAAVRKGWGGGGGGVEVIAGREKSAYKRRTVGGWG